MLTRDDPAQEREEWVVAVCAGLVGPVADHPVLDPSGIVSGPGDVDLVRALLVARVAALAAGGCSTTDIVRLLADSGVLGGPGAEPERLSDLVGTVWQLISGGMWESFWLLGCGLNAWSPESTYQLLLELWSSRRLGSASRARVRRELIRLWGVQDPAWLESCLSRQSRPLEEYANIWAMFEAEPDVRVQTCAAIAIRGDATSQRALDRWMDRSPLGTSKGRHLLTIGMDRIHVEQALRFLRRLKSPPSVDLMQVISRVREVLENLQERLAAAVEGLTTLERNLLSDRTDEERFHDGCIAELLQWSHAPMVDPWASGPDIAHGLRGPLPWGRIRVRGDHQVAAATATLSEGTRLLGLNRDSTTPDRLELVCRRPRSGSPGLRAHFLFDLTNPAHAGELLLIGRRGHICVDLVATSEDGEDRFLGTLRVTAADELTQMLTEIATKALAELSGGSEVDAEDHGVPALRQALRQAAAGAARHNPWSSDQVLLVTRSAGPGGEVVLEMTDPPTVARPRRAKAAPKPENGFVYVQRNPAMPDILKIGFSRRLPEDRAEELFGTALPFRFEVTYRAVTMRAYEVEQAVHRLLDAQRVAPDREFFRVSQTMAEEAIRFCQQRVTGIDSWAPMPVVHRLRAGDRLALPLKFGQTFVVTAYPSIMASSAEAIDMWQVHADGDILELHVTDDPGMVRGFSNGDDGAELDPLPYLNRDRSAPNGHLIGQERLMVGDRLSWLSDHADVVFEIDGFCQVFCRTWDPQFDAETGFPLLLNYVVRPVSKAAAARFRKVLALDAPRTWAPRHPDPQDGWATAATLKTQPEDWLPQLRPQR